MTAARKETSLTEKLRINGVDLLVDVMGEQHERLFIGHHGAPGLSSHAEPKRAFGPLSQWRKVVTFDARGSGASDHVGPYTHAQWVADVDAIRERFGAERFVMGGGSYGGFIALEYALAHPDRVEALVLRDTAARDYTEHAKRNALARAKEFPWLTPELVERALGGSFRDNDEFREMYKAILPLYEVDYDPAKAEEKLASLTFNYEADNYAFTHNIPNYDIRDRLHEIEVPVLITVGRHDWITPVEASEELHRLLPDSELVVFENSGHSPQFEEHEAWIATVIRFLRERELI